MDSKSYDSKKSAMSKVVGIIIFISLAFAICISTVLGLTYKQRLITLLTFLVATLVDVLVLRPLVIFFGALMQYWGFHLLGCLSRFNNRKAKYPPRNSMVVPQK
jgi:hypothetical protein